MFSIAWCDLRFSIDQLAWKLPKENGTWKKWSTASVLCYPLGTIWITYDGRQRTSTTACHGSWIPCGGISLLFLKFWQQVEASGQGHFPAASPWGKFPPINLIRRMAGPHNRSGRGVRMKYIHVPPGTELRFLGRPVPYLDIIQIEAPGTDLPAWLKIWSMYLNLFCDDCNWEACYVVMSMKRGRSFD